MSDNSIETPQVDVRGPRFAAWVTTAVLIAALLVSAASPIAAAVILGVQAVVFAMVHRLAEAAAVVFNAQAHGFAVLAQLQPGVLGMGVAQAVGQGFTGHLQQVDLFTG